MFRMRDDAIQVAMPPGNFVWHEADSAGEWQ